MTTEKQNTEQKPIETQASTAPSASASTLDSTATTTTNGNGNGNGSGSGSGSNGNNQDEITSEQLAKIQTVAQGILNPNGENPQMNEYIQSTLSYIGNAIEKMQNTNDKDATAKEIADDLTSKYESWAASKKKEEDEKKQVAEKEKLGKSD